MASKVQFIFLVVCFIAIIESGYSRTCFIDCLPSEPGCVNRTKVKTCESDENWCSTATGIGVVARNCLGDSSVESCRTQTVVKCEPCNKDNCNHPK